MKSTYSFRQILFVSGIAILLAPVAHPQERPTQTLEQRVEALEQKVKALQSQVTFLTFSNSRSGLASHTQAMMRIDMMNIGLRAWQYFKTPGSLNGGGGSYAGFSLSPKMAKTEYGIYSVTPKDTEIVIEGNAVQFTAKLRAVAGDGGRMRDWTLGGEFSGPTAPVFGSGANPPMFTDVLADEMNKIALHAYTYRMRPREMGGGGGSYRGYTLPNEMSSTATAWYSISVGDTEVVIEGRQKKYEHVRLASVGGDGKTRNPKGFILGEMKKPVGGSRTAHDSLREKIAADFVSIAARAFQFRISPAGSGGGGSYTGYLSAQTTSMDGAATYECCVDPDAVLLKASLTRGTGTMSARVDRNGRLYGWYYSGDLAN
ncbi:MAG TPA: hypothetical protein VMM37_03490 [Bacteroidota bacterium]|nr:hypothetical protein [Bacteroidota bacterium]